MSIRSLPRRTLRIASVVGALVLTPLAVTAGGDLTQNDACAAKESGATCCMELLSVCTLRGESHYDRYLTEGRCPSN